jgi:TPR repeat protein
VTEDPISEAKAAAGRGEFVSAIAVLRPLAEAGNVEAQYQLGFLAFTECDLISGREAFSLLLKAAEQGHALAMYHVATFPEFLSEPFKSPLSEEQDWSWLLRSAESGCVQAQYSAAASLATGDWGDRPGKQDLEAAVTWYRRAAEAGHAEAQFNLASMLAEGEGCERDLAAAREWLRRSVAGGYEYAAGLVAHLDALDDKAT